MKMDDPTIVARAAQEVPKMTDAQIHDAMCAISARAMATGGMLSIRDRIYDTAMRREHNLRRVGAYIG
jgi:hypothetical protein